MFAYINNIMRFDKIVDLILEQLKIVAPAVKLPSGKVVPGRVGEMHANVYDRIISRLASVNKVSRQAAEKKFDKMFAAGQIEAGFIDNEGKFRTRQDAWNISKGYDKEIEKQDKELSQREGGGEIFKKLSSEWIPQTGPAYKAAMAHA